MSGPRSEPAFGVGACASVQQRYERRDRVGEGTYGVIYRAWDRQLQRVVALKRLLPHNEAQDGFPLTSLREVSTLRLLRGHANVVTFLDVAVGARRDAVFLSLEFAEHGDLGTLLDDRSLRKGRKRLFDTSQTKCLARQLLLALRHCHERYVCHRDVKVANLLYTAEGRLKLCDFGLARIIPSIDRQLTQNVVTLWYRAPEVLLRSDLGVPRRCLHFNTSHLRTDLTEMLRAGRRPTRIPSTAGRRAASSPRSFGTGGLWRLVRHLVNSGVKYWTRSARRRPTSGRAASLYQVSMVLWHLYRCRSVRLRGHQN